VVRSNTKRGWWALILILAAVPGLAGCGVYTFNPRGASSISTIAVELFEDQTGQYGLADLITQAVTDAFIAEGSLKVESVDMAEAVLTGTMTRYERAVQEFDEQDQVSQYKVLITFDLTLENPADGTEIWSIQLPLDGLYDADEETEEDGQRRVGEKLVEAVLNKTTKSW
jgi:hypothetical protein